MNKLKKYRNKTSSGLLLGLLLPLITVVIVFLVSDKSDSLRDFVNRFIQKEILTHLISLCVLPNLALFFLFLQKNYFQTVKGILGATFIWAFLMLFLKFVVFN
jgi:hypothetical protein